MVAPVHLCAVCAFVQSLQSLDRDRSIYVVSLTYSTGPTERRKKLSSSAMQHRN